MMGPQAASCRHTSHDELRTRCALQARFVLLASCIAPCAAYCASYVRCMPVLSPSLRFPASVFSMRNDNHAAKLPMPGKPHVELTRSYPCTLIRSSDVTDHAHWWANIGKQSQPVMKLLGIAVGVACLFFALADARQVR